MFYLVRSVAMVAVAVSARVSLVFGRNAFEEVNTSDLVLRPDGVAGAFSSSS